MSLPYLAETKDVSVLQNVETGSGALSASYSVGTIGFVPSGKSQSEADHSPVPSAEVKNGWSYTFTAPVYFHGLYGDYCIFMLTFWRRNYFF